jgi:hypothetical protein
MRKNKNITKRRRYKNRRRIIRGGTIDDDADQLINSLSGYDNDSMAVFLEKMKDDPQLKNALEKRSGQFEMLKSTCEYTKELDNFVNEMITTAVKKLRNAPTPPSTTETTQTSEEPKKQLTTESISGLIPQGADLEGLINKFMEKYAAARTGPCVYVEGKQITLSPRKLIKVNSREQQHTLRQVPQYDPTKRGIIYSRGVGAKQYGVGGSRRKNKKSKRTRRKQRGGDPFLIAALVVVAILVCCYIYKS